VICRCRCPVVCGPALITLCVSLLRVHALTARYYDIPNRQVEMEYLKQFARVCVKAFIEHMRARAKSPSLGKSAPMMYFCRDCREWKMCPRRGGFALTGEDTCRAIGNVQCEVSEMPKSNVLTYVSGLDVLIRLCDEDVQVDVELRQTSEAYRKGRESRSHIQQAGIGGTSTAMSTLLRLSRVDAAVAAMSTSAAANASATAGSSRNRNPSSKSKTSSSGRVSVSGSSGGSSSGSGGIGGGVGDSGRDGGIGNSSSSSSSSSNLRHIRPRLSASERVLQE
jgi:hypothetical protein